MQFQPEELAHHILMTFALLYWTLWNNEEKKVFHELMKVHANPSLIVGTSSCSGISCICSRHSWWRDRVCLPYFISTSHWCPRSSVICFCAVALSLAAKQPYDMVAAFLLQNHCPLPPPPQSRGSVTTRLEHHQKECSPLQQLAQHNDQYLLDWCSALLRVLKLSLLIMESSVGAVL